ncbi:hypothetical protein QR680_011750 [Steinernema hermaphroditum]|uniref:SXP/RAL-2 family protein Ani s 5-like cation-binding domain-containing protein n=1 Tax=Steinernema hermaphroditum TaxID=289476 RepID=A0AA39HZM7_9BILA|nr:hypothetical protein QR680_011750 [Steinernema hermaphroditum]
MNQLLIVLAVCAVVAIAREYPLDFISGAPKDVVSSIEYYAHFGSFRKNGEAAVNKWIAKQPRKIKDAYAKLKADREAHTAHVTSWFHDEMLKITNDLIADAAKDKKLTTKQKNEKIKKLINSLPKEVRGKAKNPLQG